MPTESGVKIVVRDAGRWVERPANPADGNGYGLQLMHDLVDDLVIRPDDASGTEVIIRQRLTR
jgi:hypothetical protein